MTMMVSDVDSRQPLIPNFLYTTTHPASPILTHGGFRPNNNSPFPSTPAKLHHNNYNNDLMIPAPDETALDKDYKGGFPDYFHYGISHMLWTPFDLDKCRKQMHPGNWKTIMNRIEGQQDLNFAGWRHNLVGFGVYGAFKTGFYDFFKKYYSDIAGSEYAAKHKTLINVVSTGSAEVIASIILCPMEAVKVRFQTQPGFPTELEGDIPKIYRSIGVHGLYKGLLPLWGRQIPYTMVQFGLYEGIEEMLYKNWIRSPKNECSPPLQCGVLCVAGHVAAVPCAIVSHPADTLFTFLNSAKGATVGDALKKFGIWGLCTRGLGMRMFFLGPLIVAECGICGIGLKVDEVEKVNLDGDGTSNTDDGDDVLIDQYFNYFN